MRKLLLAILLAFVGYEIYRHYFFVSIPKKAQNIKVGNDSKLVTVSDIDVTNLTFEGMHANNIYYIINANLATQIADKIFSLKTVNAKYMFNKNHQILLNATDVLFNQQHDKIYFNKNIKLNVKDYYIYTNYIEVDFKKLLFRAKNGVRLNGNGVNLVSDECNISNNYKDIIFSGNVKTDINFNNLHKY